MKYFFSLIVFCALLCSPAVSVSAQDISDPIEPFNRAMFTFNDKLDIYILEPVARGYDYVLPSPAKKGVSNFFDNIRYPVHLLSSVISLRFRQAGVHTLRFFLNTTVGIAGLVDVAKDLGLEPSPEDDFGSGLGRDGVGFGPYLVVPFLGPSSVRDIFGRGVDTVASPTWYIPQFWIPATMRGVEIVDDRRKLLDATDLGRKSSLDYYIFVRSSFYQHRLNVIYDGKPPAELLGGYPEDTFVPEEGGEKPGTEKPEQGSTPR